MGLYTVSDSIPIDAPIERCFLLSTSIDVVALALGMKPMQGKTTGLVQLNDRILWQGWKFGLPQLHETIITEYQHPNFFQDTMGRRGRFQHFQHDHALSEVAGQTLLHDEIRFSLPLGWLGRIVAKWIMVPYIARILRLRLETLKLIAQTEAWRKYLPPDTPPSA